MNFEVWLLNDRGLYVWLMATFRFFNDAQDYILTIRKQDMEHYVIRERESGKEIFFVKPGEVSTE